MQITFVPGPPGLPPLVIRAVAGTLSKRGGTLIEGQVEQRQRRHQAVGYPLLADVSESVQAVIRQLFDVYHARGLRIPQAPSLTVRNGLAGGGLVGSIFCGRWCVMSTCLCLPQLRERTGQWSGEFGISRLRGVAALIFNVSCVGNLMLPGTPSLHTFSSFSITSQRPYMTNGLQSKRHPSSRPALTYGSSK
jgi:hypothetical protein